jgi:hypothetical protein
MSAELSREDIHEAIDRAVAELLAAAGVSVPPVDAIALAKNHLGLVVSYGASSPGQRRRRSAGKEILLPADARVEMQQWMAAHTIGKYLEADLQRRIGIDPKEARGMKGESLANLFATRLLVPTRWLAHEARATGHDLLALKERFAGASHEVIAWRLLDVPEPCIITLIDDDRVERRRSNAWRITRELSEPEKRCGQQVLDIGGPCQYSEDGWTVQGWPLPGGVGKRAVLRSVVDT